ncbi:hypothetical protein [Methylobacterium sp. E-066]|uniref:hypothetical protein n=1 Tax=Methylobacterium sp. E-066 TaxID=2836584 RepID=UPI001FBBDE69|nr:hypothetical protein [Methylobacterium sp. E-066]MCJ2138463.1 hypothetical protein [Methylobacterium sp. E-066]
METNLKEARAALAAAEQKEKAEQEATRKREARHKDFMAGMSRLALAATAMATAVSYATNRVTKAFDHLGFVSARTGASVQSLNSLSYAFKQVGGSSEQAVSFVENFAKAIRENSGVKSYVQSLGVDMTKDAADQALDTVRALNKHPYDVGFREAGLAGISEENYKLVTDYIKKLDEYRAEYDATTKSLGVNSKEAADASMAFQRTLTRLQATVSALGDKLMVSLAPALEAIVKRFQDWISANPEKVEHIMTGISNAVVWLAEKLGAMVTWFAGNEGDAFMKRWDAFADRVKSIANAFETIFGVLKKIAGVTHLSTILGAYDKTIGGIMAGPAAFEKANGGPGVVIGSGGPVGPVRDDRSLYERFAPKSWGGKPDPNAPADPRGGLRARAARAMRGDQSGGVAANPGAYKDVLDHIARSEGTAKYPNGGYDTSLGYGRYLPGRQEQKLTTKTLDEILALGNYMRRQPGNPNSSAMGRYQIVGDTLRDQMRKLGLKSTDLFDEKTQDRIGANLARQRGANSTGLRNEWASLVGANNRIAVELMQKVDPKASTVPLDRVAQSSIQVTSPKIEVKGADGSSAAPQIHVPGLPKMMQMPDFNVADYMKPLSPGANSVVNNGGSTSKSVNQTFNQTTTINGAENPRQAARIMESAFGNMHSLALQNAQSATV